MLSIVLESGNCPMNRYHYFRLTDGETEAEIDQMKSYARDQIGDTLWEPQFEASDVHFHCDLSSWCLELVTYYHVLNCAPEKEARVLTSSISECKLI